MQFATLLATSLPLLRAIHALAQTKPTAHPQPAPQAMAIMMRAHKLVVLVGALFLICLRHFILPIRSQTIVTIHGSDCIAMVDFSLVSSVEDGTCTACTSVSVSDCSVATCANGFHTYDGAGSCAGDRL